MKNKTYDEVSIYGGDYIKEEFGELKKKLQFISPYLLIIGKSHFLKNILKLINVWKRYFKESLITDIFP